MRELLSGAEAICRGAIDTGCNFFAGYPITPSAQILHILMEQLPAKGGVAIQGEDEIASMGFCIGAAMAGAKVLTATSGPGMSLKSENIGLAIMLETPMVIIDVQRMGPATGGATTNSEGDIMFLGHCAPGGYPIITLAPSTVADSYTLTMKAFNLAERFRTPVIIATSKDLVMNLESVDVDDLVQEKIYNRKRFTGNGEYKPYAFNKLSDIPEFLEIGADKLVRYTTSIHDERGIITGNLEKIDRKLRHLVAKIKEHSVEIEMVETDLEKGADTAILAYGMMARISKEVIQDIRAKGKKISLIHVYSLWPFPEQKVKTALNGVKKIVVPELNPGEYVNEIRKIAGDREIVSVTRVDGRLISPSELIERGKL